MIPTVVRGPLHFKRANQIDYDKMPTKLTMIRTVVRGPLHFKRANQIDYDSDCGPQRCSRGIYIVVRGPLDLTGVQDIYSIYEFGLWSAVFHPFN